VISYHHLHLGIVNEFAQDFGFGRIRAGQAFLCIDAVDADEHDIGEKHLGGGGCERTHESEPTSAEMPSRHYHLDVLPVTQFHCHIDGICDDGNVAEHLKAPNHFGCCGAAAQGNGLSRANETGCRHRNPPLFFGETVYFVLKRTVIPKRLLVAPQSTPEMEAPPEGK